MIPRLLHRIWIGGAIPEPFETYWRAWRDLHPGWELLTWTERELVGLVNQALYEEMPTLAGKADVARYDILASHGGVYVDCDVEPLRDISPLLDGVGAFCGWEDGDNITNAVMGSEQGHPAALALATELPGWAAAYSADLPNRRTGPAFLMAFWRYREDVVKFPPVTFYPIPPGGQGQAPWPEESYAVHHWAKSWM